MKLSVSIPDDDVQLIDHDADEHGLDTRSGAVHRALSLLRVTELGQDAHASAGGVGGCGRQPVGRGCCRLATRRPGRCVEATSCGSISIPRVGPVRQAPSGGRRQQRRREHHGATSGTRGRSRVLPVNATWVGSYPFQGLLADDRRRPLVTSKAQAEQIRSVSVGRVGGVVGRLPADPPEAVEQRSGSTSPSEHPAPPDDTIGDDG